MAAERTAAQLIGCRAGTVDRAAVADDVAVEVLGRDGGTPDVQYRRELVRTLAATALRRVLAAEGS